MNGAMLHAMDAQYILSTYARAPMVLERGQGNRVYDTDGKEYLDFVSGIAVNALGHGDPDVLAAISEQAARLMHVSNLYLTAPQTELAKLLVEHSFADKVFFCNSGTEAVEAAVKFARKWATTHYGPERTGILAMENAFHGRTMGALSLTPRPAYQDAFRPLVPGAKFAPLNDLAAVEALLDERTCACILEPIQGEGGVRLADAAFLQGVRALCDERQILLILDEVQCGLGRTGTLWAHEPSGITPDLMTLAKPLAGGLPMGAVLLTDRVAAAMRPGDHGSTFAGSPLVCAAARVVLQKLTASGFLAHVQAMGDHLHRQLQALASRHAAIQGVRGRGLIWGLDLGRDVGPLVQLAAERGLLICKAGANVLRLLPPLVVQQEEIDCAVQILDGALADS